MKNGFRQSMAWLHTWTGLLVGWVLLLIFMAGTASYYREEISRWMRPELPRNAVDADQAAANALAFLRAPLHGRFDIVFLDPPFAADLWPEAFAALPSWLAGAAWRRWWRPMSISPFWRCR